MINNNIELQNFYDKNIISIPNFKEKYICPNKCLPWLAFLDEIF